MKVMQTFKFDQELIDLLKKIAKKENRPFNNLVETELINYTIVYSIVNGNIGDNNYAVTNSKVNQRKRKK